MLLFSNYLFHVHPVGHTWPEEPNGYSSYSHVCDEISHQVFWEIRQRGVCAGCDTNAAQKILWYGSRPAPLCAENEGYQRFESSIFHEPTLPVSYTHRSRLRTILNRVVVSFCVETRRYNACFCRMGIAMHYLLRRRGVFETCCESALCNILL